MIAGIVDALPCIVTHLSCSFRHFPALCQFPTQSTCTCLFVSLLEEKTAIMGACLALQGHPELHSIFIPVGSCWPAGDGIWWINALNSLSSSGKFLKGGFTLFSY